MKNGNEKIFFIPRNQVPTGRKITYENTVCDYLPHKDDPYCLRLTISGDKLPYPLESSSPAANLLESKIPFNGIISIPDSQFICTYTKDYFLCSHI